MASLGTVQFTGYANGTTPEVETNSLGTRVTIKPNDPGVEACYGTFGLGCNGAAGIGAVGTSASPHLILINRNSDILIRPKKIQVNLGTGALGPAAGVWTTQLWLIRNILTGNSAGGDAGSNAPIPSLRNGRFPAGQIASLDAASVAFDQPLMFGLVIILSGGIYTADASPIASTTTSISAVAGTRGPSFALWDTAMGDGLIDLQDGNGIAVAFTAVASGGAVASINIIYEQVDPKLQ